MCSVTVKICHVFLIVLLYCRGKGGTENVDHEVTLELFGEIDKEASQLNFPSSLRVWRLFRRHLMQCFANICSAVWIDVSFDVNIISLLCVGIG